MRRHALVLMIVLLALGGSSDVYSQSALPLEQMDGQIASALGTLEEARALAGRTSAEMEGLAAQRDAAADRLRTRARALYRMRRAGVLPLAGGFEALLRHQSRIERLERMVVHDVEAQRSLAQRVSALNTEATRLASEIQAHERTVTELREQKEALERATIGQLAGIVPAPAEGMQPSAWPSTTSGVGLRVLDEARPRFAELHGRLPLPVVGSARLEDGEREGGAGIEIAASIGANVLAVGPGRVAYAATHPAYGRLVIVDHGDSYYSVYGSLGALGVAAGQQVPAEATLGSVGTQPMFFQVRQGTRALPARAWLGL